MVKSLSFLEVNYLVRMLPRGSQVLGSGLTSSPQSPKATLPARLLVCFLLYTKKNSESSKKAQLLQVLATKPKDLS